MAMQDLLKLFKIGRETGGKNRHARKAGPGRMPPSRHQEGAKRLEVRTPGGNWQGQPYLSYAEHDEATRGSLQFTTERDKTYSKVRERIESARA